MQSRNDDTVEEEEEAPPQCGSVDSSNTTFVTEAMLRESEKLFPHIRAPRSEPRLRPPEYLGRNPYSELRRRQEHQLHLQAADQATTKKAAKAQEDWNAQRALATAQLHPAPKPFTVDELAAMEANPRYSQILLPPLGSPLASPMRLGDVASPNHFAADNVTAVSAEARGRAVAIASPLSTSSSSQMHPLGDELPLLKEQARRKSSYALASVAAWSATQRITHKVPLITQDAARQSTSQLVKYKAQKHLGYFGADVEHATITTFGDEVKKLLAMPPSADSFTFLANEPFQLNDKLFPDSALLSVIFGSHDVRIPRATATLKRKCDAQGKGGESDGGGEAHELLNGLRLLVQGRPSAPWAGEPVTVELWLSRFAYCAKSVSLTTVAKQYSSVFDRFGVRVDDLVAAVPFPLRLPPNVQSAQQDISKLNVTFFAKRQARVFNADFVFPLFGGCLKTKASLTVSGTLGCSQASFVQLVMAVPMQQTPGFTFRSAARMLSFLDVFPLSDVVFSVVLREERAAGRDTDDDDDDEAEVYEDAAAGSGLQSGESISWKATDAGKPRESLVGTLNVDCVVDLKTLPMMAAVRRLLEDENSVAMSGLVGPWQSMITLRSKPLTLGGSRVALLWNFLKLRNVTAFVECEEGNIRYGVECIVGVPMKNDIIEFEGRLVAELTESALTSITTPQELERRKAPTMTFSGRALSSVWEGALGIPFAHLTDMTLNFSVAADTVLPLSANIAGTLLLQNGGIGTGGCAVKLPATLWFALDSLPDGAITADICDMSLEPLVHALLSVPDDSIAAAAADVSSASAMFDGRQRPHSSDENDGESESSSVQWCALARRIHVTRGLLTLNAGNVSRLDDACFTCPPGVFLHVHEGLLEPLASLTPTAERFHTSGRVQLAFVNLRAGEDARSRSNFASGSSSSGAFGPSPILLEGSLEVAQPVYLGELVLSSRLARNSGPFFCFRVTNSDRPSRGGKQKQQQTWNAPLDKEIGTALNYAAAKLASRVACGFHRCALTAGEVQYECDFVELSALDSISAMSRIRIHSRLLCVPPLLKPATTPTTSSPVETMSDAANVLNDKYFTLRVAWESDPSADCAVGSHQVKNVRVVGDNLSEFQKCGVNEALHEAFRLLVLQHRQECIRRVEAHEGTAKEIQELEAKLLETTKAHRQQWVRSKAEIASLRNACTQFQRQKCLLLRRLHAKVRVQNAQRRRALVAEETADVEQLSKTHQEYAARTLRAAGPGTVKERFRRSRFRAMVGSLHHQASTATAAASKSNALIMRRLDALRADKRTLAHLLVAERRDTLSLSTQLFVEKTSAKQLQHHVALLDRDLIAFSCIYSIDELRIVGQSQIWAHGDSFTHNSENGPAALFLGLALKGTIRKRPFESVYAFERGSMRHSEMRNAIMHHAREMLRLTVVTQKDGE